jgi:hypothetical protein
MTVRELMFKLMLCDPAARVGHFHPDITLWVEPVDEVYVHQDGTVLLAPGEKRPEGLYGEELDQVDFVKL